MTGYVIPAPEVRTLAVTGRAERFPVNRIFCVGRNYAAHAREMGMDEREPPFFFMKAANAIVDASASDARIAYPPMTGNFHHEIELVVAIGKDGFRVPREQAPSLVYGYAVGLDMTRRDLQFALRDKGRPWEFGKAFDQSAPIGAITPASQSGHLAKGEIRLLVNGTQKQKSDLSNMIWDVAESIAFLTRYEPLLPGDLIMTGTPEGVGAVHAGDRMEGHIDGLQPIHVTVTEAR